jgi:hypothetical protein
MSLLSILVLMFILYDHRFRIVLFLLNMYFQSFSWQIFLQRFRLVLTISFTSSNLVLLIYHEFERRIRYILVFFIIIFLKVFFIYSHLLIYIYVYIHI